MRRLLPNPQYGLDSGLLLALAALTGWGLVMVASASVDIGQKLAGSSLYFFDRQALFIVFGAICASIAFTVPMRLLQSITPVLFVGSLLLLVAVLIPGVGLRVNDSRRWLNFIVFRLQASEPARLALVIYLAGYIVRHQRRLQNGLLGLAAVFLPLSFASLLMLAEPDFGATAILLGVAILMLFLGGARLRDVGVLAIVLGIAMGVLAVAAPYRVARLMSFVDPWTHADGSGFQLVQSLIAVGRGRWLGVGLGNSVQKLLYLPEMHTDFIFAILAEELGLAGVISLVLLYAVVVWRGFQIGRCAEHLGQQFKASLCYGLSGWIGLQALINMAVNMGLLPTKGLTLPFISYGGSSLVTDFVMMALILRVDFENRLALAGHPMADGPGEPDRKHLPQRSRRGPDSAKRPVRRPQQEPVYATGVLRKAMANRLQQLVRGRR